ncbi:TonB family protein, partial [bacterium]|nr:TonB family protein [bacterium]
LLTGLAPPSSVPDRPAPVPRPVPVVIVMQDEIVVPEPPPSVKRPSPPPLAEPEPWVPGEVESPVPERSAPEARELSVPPSVGAARADFVVFDDPPRPRRMAVVEYPESARAAGVEGWVICAIRIDEEGRVTDVRILDGSAEMFHEAARTALRASTFTPARQSGRPVACVVVQRIEFTLD